MTYPALIALLGRVNVAITWQSIPPGFGEQSRGYGVRALCSLEVSVIQAQGREIGFQTIRN